MTTYVDQPTKRLGRMKTCHLIADTVSELHAMAHLIGCERSWFQVSRSGVPHYDIPKFRRALAIAFGATELTNRELVQKTKIIER